MKDYEEQEKNVTSMAAEPQVAYGESQQIKSMPQDSLQNIPLGFVSLERFGELFHEKLDACYAELQGNSK